MEGEIHHYELRSRSRSRSQTPQVLNQSVTDPESPEHHYDLRSRSRERSHTPGEVTSSRRSGSRSLPGSGNKSHEKSMETISEQTEEQTEVQNQQNQSMKTSTAKKVERRSERQRAKRQIFTNGQNDETTDNVSNDKVERQRRSQTPRRILTSDYSSEERETDEREDPPSRPGSAYEIYKQAGEWWNVFPKTDYTYSQKSACRYEIAPGVLAMPNMSRRSIHSDSNSTGGSIPSTSQQNLSQSSSQLGAESTSLLEGGQSISKDYSTPEDNHHLYLHSRHPDSVARSMIYKTTHVEHYNSRREMIYSDAGNLSPFETLRDKWNDSVGNTPFPRRLEGVLQNADSDTDIDDTMTTVDGYRRMYNERQQKELGFFLRTWTRILTIITTSYTRVKDFVGLGETRRRWSSSSYSYRQQNETKWSKAKRLVDNGLQYFYLLLVNILFLDSWLLSRFSDARETVHSRRSKILWIILLPLLLLAGWWFVPYILPFLQGVLAFATYPFTFLVSLAYSVPSFNEIIDSSAVQSVFVPMKQASEAVVDSLKFSQSSNYGWKEEVTKEPLAAAAAASEWNVDVEKEREFNSIIALLAERVGKMESGNAIHGEQVTNMNGIIAMMMKSNEELRKHYDDKLAAVEEQLKDKEALLSSSNSEEMNAIKIELQSLREQQLELKSCCDKTIAIPTVEIEKHVNSILAGYFGNDNGDGQTVYSKDDIANMINNLLIAKRDLEERIANITTTINVDAQEVKDLADRVMSDITNQLNIISLTRDEGSGGGDNNGLTKADVHKIVEKAIRVYNADKTGRVDYALESAGGQIISTRCTQQYNMNTRAYQLLGFTLFYEKNSPRTVIQGNAVQPGACWVFQDFPGYLLIKLRGFVKITGFTLEHAPRSTLPNGEMRSAPRKFNVWGFKDENDREPVEFGDYEFLDSDESLQYFPVQNTSITEPYEFVELRIHSNHGQLEYTCLYRFRVHGTIA